MEKPKDEDGEIVLLRKQRRQLIEQVDNQRQCREQYLKNLNSLMPDLAETLELTVKVVSSFGGLDISTKEMPLTRHSSAQLLALHSSGRVDGILDLQLNKEGKITPGKPAIRAPLSKTNLGPSNGADNDTERDASSEAFGIVKGIVINCLMAPNITFPIDSTGVFRRLGKDSSPSHRAALSEVGGEGGGVAAVEAALKAIGEGSMPAAEIEECTLGGKSRLMVLMVDRGRLIKELSEFSQLQSVTNDSNNNIIQGSGAAITDVPHGVHSMSTRSDMWVGTGDQSLQVGNMGVPPLPGTCPPMFTSAGSPMIGPRGPRVMGMMGMPGPGGASAMGMAYGAMPFQRPPLGPNPGLMPGQGGQGPLPTGASGKMRGSDDDVMKDLEALLSKKSFRELQKSKTGEELLDLLHRPTAKETAVAAKFKTKGGSALKEYCSALTKEDCRRQRNSYLACEKVHFRRIIALHTDVNLGDCSFLDTCRHMKTCKYVHYELDPTPDVPGMMGLPPPQKPITKRRADYCSEVELGEPQWINCDIRNFKMDVLGKFGVIMADPPWDIHMELPYGTMADDEMRNLNVPALQTDGLIFLWVTGRAMELGRECLELWGYKRVEELIWVKTNQLQRIIRTGRTGHWLNHSKEHCLVGIKGHPEMNRNIDTDVIVAEVRETSRKPDEMYPMLERISPRTRKLELFARMHNTHAGWISLGNQLNGVRLVDEGLRARFKAAYPDVEVQPSDAPAKTTSTEEGETAPQGNSSPKSAGKEANVTNSVEKVLTDEKVHQESET